MSEAKCFLIKDEYDDRSVCVVQNVTSKDEALEAARRLFSVKGIDDEMLYTVELPLVNSQEI